MGIGQYDLLKNVQPAETTNLNILNVNKINTFKDEEFEGDIVSFELLTTLTKEKIQELIDYAIPAFSLPAEANLTEAYGDVDIYKIVYLAREARATDSLVQMSGTLCIPKTITKTYYSMYGHGTIYNFTTLSTLRDNLVLYQNGEVTAEFMCKSASVEGFGALAVGQVVMVQADDIGYGVTRGRSPGVDKEANVYSYTGALVATKNLMKSNPENIFDKFIAIKDPFETIDVVLEGFSQFANNITPLGAYIMQYKEQFGLNIKLMLSEGPVQIGPSNAYPQWAGAYYPVINSAYTQKSFKLVSGGYLSLGLGGWPQTPTSEMGMTMINMYRPNILSDVILKNNSLYVKQEPVTNLVQFADENAKIVLATIQSMLNNPLYEADGTYIPPYWLIFPDSPTVPVAAFRGKILPYTSTVPGLNFVPLTAADIARVYVNSKYIFLPEIFDNVAFITNASDITSNINVPLNNLEGVPLVQLTIVTDELIRFFGISSSLAPSTLTLPTGLTVPYYPFAFGPGTSISQLPDPFPKYFKSFVTGSEILNEDNAFFNKFIPDSANPGYYVPVTTSSQWKRNTNNTATNGKSRTPTCLERSVDLYEENLNYDSAKVLDMAEDIVSAVGTERCILYQCAQLPGYNISLNPQYGTHGRFAVYTNLCISYNVLKNLN